MIVCALSDVFLLTYPLSFAGLGQLCIDHAAAVEHTHQLVTRRLQQQQSGAAAAAAAA
jgi:hypothetical protein